MTIEPEFARSFPLAAVPPEGRAYVVSATAEECTALAARFGIPTIGRLEASLELRPEPGGAVRARGRMSADVVQACVVTLEPVPQRIDEAVDLRFLPDNAQLSDDPEGPDEVLAERGRMELGEALAEHLSLALDPYPRAPGAKLPDIVSEAPEAEEPAPRPNPFAVLKGGKTAG